MLQYPVYNYQRSLDNAESGPQIDFRGFREWTTRNYKSARNDISRPIREIGRSIRRICGGGRKKDSAPVEYANYEGLSSDPLAGSSASTQNASFSGGGIESGGLGITVGNVQKINSKWQEEGYFTPINPQKDSSSEIYKKAVNNIAHFLNLKAKNEGLTNNITVKSFGINNFEGSRSGYATLLQKKTFTSEKGIMEVVLNFSDNEIVTTNKPTKIKRINGVFHGYEFTAPWRLKLADQSHDTSAQPPIFRILFSDKNTYNQFIKDINSKLNY